MNFKHTLPRLWIERVVHMEEFANGEAQVSIETNDGKKYEGVLISNSTWIIAMRGEKELPFKVEDIAKIFQTEEDKNPKDRSNWIFWDRK
jgi:hypothetical protein